MIILVFIVVFINHFISFNLIITTTMMVVVVVMSVDVDSVTVLPHISLDCGFLLTLFPTLFISFLCRCCSDISITISYNIFAIVGENVVTLVLASRLSTPSGIDKLSGTACCFCCCCTCSFRTSAEDEYYLIVPTNVVGYCSGCISSSSRVIYSRFLALFTAMRTQSRSWSRSQSSSRKMSPNTIQVASTGIIL